MMALVLFNAQGATEAVRGPVGWRPNRRNWHWPPGLECAGNRSTLSGLGIAIIGCLLMAVPIRVFATGIQYSYDSMQRLTRAMYSDGGAIEYVYDNLGNRLMKTITVSPVASNNPPAAVSSPGIANGALNVSATPTLSWVAASDRDPSDSVAYYVYFGNVPVPPLVYSGWPTNWTAGSLQCFTTYYWYIVARDNHNAQSTSPVWSFTTGDVPPVPDFAIEPSCGAAPLTVNFHDQSQYPCGTLSLWQWDFNNDGVVESTSRSPAFTYRAPGDYSVKLAVQDEHGGLGTVVKTNLVSVLGSNIINLAALDLKIESAGPYRNLIVSYSVTNTGTISLSGRWQWSDKFYLSSNPVFDSHATTLASFDESQSLPAGAVYRRTNMVTVSGTGLAGRYLFLNADAANELEEGDLSDNVVGIAADARLPDLVAGSLSCYGDPVAGQMIDVTYSVTNRGALPIIGLSGTEVEFYDQFYLSSNATWDANAILIGGAVFSGTLLEGASHTQTDSAYLPWWPPGNYFLIVRVNGLDMIAESDSDNNSLSIPISLGAPDLAPVSISAPQRCASDARIDVVCTITNLGNAIAAGPWVDTLYVSTNSDWDEHAFKLGDFFEDGPVGVHAAWLATNSVRLPGWAAGSYYLWVQVDSWKIMPDASRANNMLALPITFVAPAGLPDLVPLSLKAPASALPGSSIEVLYCVTNSGRTALSGEWFDELWLSTNAVWDGTATIVGFQDQSGPLSSGAGYSETNQVTIPKLTPPGPYYLILQANVMGLAEEATLTNNDLALPIEILPPGPMPDLAMLPPSVPASAVQGQMVQLLWGVTNQGPGEAQAPWFDAVYFSSNSLSEPSETLLVFHFQQTNLPPAASYLLNSPFVCPSVPSGTYYLILASDLGGQLSEPDTDNNVLVIPLEVGLSTTGPNLAPIAVTAPSVAVPGRPFPVICVVTNRGDDSAAGSWNDQLVLSKNPVWDAGDYLLASHAQSQTVGPGQAYTFTNTIILPPWDAGQYYLLLKANASGSLTESTLSDNTLALSILCHSIKLSGSEYLSTGGGFKVAVSGLLGSPYTLWSSTNLIGWQKVCNFTCTNLPTWIVDPAVSNGAARFYRVTPAP